MANARRARVQSRRFDLSFEFVVSVRELEARQELGQPVDLLRGQSEHLAHLAHRAARAVGDDVGGHRRAVRTVALIDVLQDLFAPVSRGQIQVDVGPLAALLGQEALKQQLVADRVDGGNAEGVADQTVGRRAATLHQDSPLRGTRARMSQTIRK